MKELYWLILNQHAFKPHGAYLFTPEVIMSPCFSAEAHRGHEYTRLEKIEKDTHDGAAQSALYYRNQYIGQGCACHVTG